jgi:hypothetical protein
MAGSRTIIVKSPNPLSPPVALGAVVAGQRSVDLSSGVPATPTTPVGPISMGAPASIVSANLVTAAALTTWLGMPTGTADQWAYGMQVFLNGTDSTGNPLQTPFVPPQPECYGFGTCVGPNGASGQQYCGCPNPLAPVYQRTQTVTATQFLAALRAYQQPATSAPVVNTGPASGQPPPATGGNTGVAGVAGTSTNSTQSGPVVSSCPTGQTCLILGNGIPDMFVYLGAAIALGLGAWFIFKPKVA